ncbi:transmembrane protease serine 2-like isoform X2 [Nerophis lumbriciformis]|uniref:transmembrane protease serine 2-like isoform X2 n=1 Tax=Nerophis lumbriciformis TaxID=546530 RepID=UPI002AE03895|nr:transmembrane protease serine 2-like isoform X2 [Nerophis lumbriciformis]
MSTSLSLDPSERLRHDAAEKTRLPGNLELKPQFVHHLTSSPSPDLKNTPRHKGFKRRCVTRMLSAGFCLLIFLLLVGILLAYYFSSRCIHGVQCSAGGGCVWASQWCDGVRDCPHGQDEDDCVRLHGSNFLLQVYNQERWRSVCSHGWTPELSRASCRDMGYSGSTKVLAGSSEELSQPGLLVDTSQTNPHVPLVQQLAPGQCPGDTVVTLQCTACAGVNSSQPSGSQQASLGAWPWQVSLQVAGTHRCGGAIISPWWIVTAARCALMTSSAADWSVYAGVLRPEDLLFTPAASVSLLVVHEDFDANTQRNDIALMRLSSPLHFSASSHVGPVCLPNVGLNLSLPLMGWTTGYGGPGHGVMGGGLDPDGWYLLQAQVFLEGPEACNTSASHQGTISEDMFCGARAEPASQMCRSDSGGPLVWQMGGVWWLLGDHVWSAGCGESNRGELYSNVTFFLDWIHLHMKKHLAD